MNSNVKLSTLQYDSCIGCGICACSCPNKAIKMELSKYKEIKPGIALNKCSYCGICSEYCPHTKDKILAEALKISRSSDPNSFGLENAVYMLAHDKNEDNRKKSASGGITTALIKHLFDKKRIDGVIHAAMRYGAIGELHYEASISCSFEEADKKRSSFYGPIDYSQLISKLKNTEKKYLIVGVPCVIRALTKLFREHAWYNKNTIYTVALSCGHNVNGQFIDFLAESLGIPENMPFKVNLRNKEDIKDANNYNNHFFCESGDIIKTNRFQSVYTDAWRNYFFSLNACSYCSDFWGYAADISVKDAWGRWAENPLGDSIVICRSRELLDEVLKSKDIEYEYLDFDITANSQSATTEYKQVKVMDRLGKPVWHRDNIRSGYLKYAVLSRLSKYCYRYLGYRQSKRILFFFLQVLRKIEKRAEKLEDDGFKNMVKRAHKKRVVFFGTGEMAKTLKKALSLKIEYYVDNDSKKHNTFINSIPVKNPDILFSENKEEIFIIVASMYYDQISIQLEKIGLAAGINFMDGRMLYERLVQRPGLFRKNGIYRYISFALKPIKKIFIYEKSKDYKKILILGGYGYKNTGDEAQLSSAIKLLKNEFPSYIIKVLTPNQPYTYFEHGECAVGDAPRVAFYNQGETFLYMLDTRWKKIRFILVSILIYINAFFVRAGLPTFLINAKKAALLYDICTSDIVYFCGGGYLTGKTLSRLWDGMFFIRIANVFRVPVFLSGQTIGVWGNSFNKRLARWGLSKAKIITLRDPVESIKALKEIGLSGEHIFTTFDDALFCEKLEDEKSIAAVLLNSGMNNEQVNRGYIAFNIHYWGLSTDDDKKKLLGKINAITGIILNKTSYNILFIPMIPSDMEAINEYMLNNRSERLFTLSYDYDFRTVRSVIGKSEICVTMKHHPIIFALGEKVPVISLALSDYYEQKNIGSLKIFGLEKYNVMLLRESYYKDFELNFDEIAANKDSIIRTVEERFSELKQKREYYISQMKRIVFGNIHNTSGGQ